MLPPGLLLLLFGVSFYTLIRGKLLAGYCLLAAALAVFVILSLPISAYWLDSSLNQFDAIDLSRPVDAEAIVILGGGRLVFTSQS